MFSPQRTSPRSITRQAKLHRLLKQLHGVEAPQPIRNGRMNTRQPMQQSCDHELQPLRSRSSKRNGAPGRSSASRSRSRKPQQLRLSMAAIKSLEEEGASYHAAEDEGAAHGPRQGQKSARARSKGAETGASTSAADGAAGPTCMFKGYRFTSDNPPETAYDFSVVPNCKPELAESVLLRPSSRRQWFVCLKELESLAKESLDRRAKRLQLSPPSGLPLVYIADRLDIDDPLWGYQIRCEQTGWLQGFITLTVFTTWTRFFEWDSLSASSGMPAARVANALVDKPDPAVDVLSTDESVHQIAARNGVRASDIVQWNVSRFPAIHANSRMVSGSHLFVLDPARCDMVTVERKGETARQLASRVGLSIDDFLLLNAKRTPSLTATPKLKPGTEYIARDRSAEPEVFLPTNAQVRKLDVDGALATDLQQQERFGDPMTTGVVWPRVAEIALLAGLGCGKKLVELALEELGKSGEFDFVVLQATMASVSFYEEMGFVRVGAVARYASHGTPLDEIPLQGYRHWASADESQLEQFGDTSYMMALRLTRAKAKSRKIKALSKRLAREWPEVQSATSGKRHGASSGNQAGIVGGASAVQVGDMAVNIAEGDDARLQLRYEVERVLDQREGSASQVEYLVKWKHFAVEDATWEDSSSEYFKPDVAKSALLRYRKLLKRKEPGDKTPAVVSCKRKGRASEASHKRVGHDADTLLSGLARAAGGRSDSPRQRGGDESARRRAADTPVVRGCAWMRQIVRLPHGMEEEQQLPSQRIFEGGLGEPRALLSPQPGEAKGAPPDREYRYWYVARYSSATGKCTLLPLLPFGRFGGCGRRAGRIRWRVAPHKHGYEREAHSEFLQPVSAESVTGAREPLGEAWSIDEVDVEHAAREQAAAVRNKRRRLLAEAEADMLGAIQVGSAGVAAEGVPLAALAYASKPGAGRTRDRRARVPRKAADVAARKKRRLAPICRTCLACTKGKHSAHTCGVRGKRSSMEMDQGVAADAFIADADAMADADADPDPAAADATADSISTDLQTDEMSTTYGSSGC